MGRLLLFLVLVLVAIWLYKSWQRKQSQNEQQDYDAKSGVKKGLKGNNMQPCLYCGTYSAVDVGVMIEGRFYCNLEHARLKGEE